MDIFLNTPRQMPATLETIPWPSTDAQAVAARLANCPHAAQTPLQDHSAIARQTNVGAVWIKDERARMGLGSFKALGAAYVIAHDAGQGLAKGRTYVTASAGNHGMSVAAGAQAFGAQAVVFIAQTVPESFAQRLRDLGAEVVRAGEIYEDSMAAAAQAAEDNGWDLLSDSSWPGYVERPHRLMEGYLMLMHEVITQIPSPPTHLFLQAGVGGLAGACAAMARAAWGDAVNIIVVEPDQAPALIGSMRAGKPVAATGGVSQMGRLDCKEPSLIALKGLARDADLFVTISEAQGQAGAALTEELKIAGSASGAAGIAALLTATPAERAHLGLNSNSQVLCILSEGPA